MTVSKQQIGVIATVICVLTLLVVMPLHLMIDHQTERFPILSRVVNFGWGLCFASWVVMAWAADLLENAC